MKFNPIRPSTGGRRGRLAGATAGLALVAAAAVALAGPVAVAGAVTANTLPTFALVAAVGCESSTACIATGNATINPDTGAATAGALYSTDTAAKWKTGKVPSGYLGIYGIDCVSKSVCYAVAAKSSGAGAVLGTKNANSSTGPTWKAKALVNASGGTFEAPNAISCPSSTICYVAGSSDSGANAAIVKIAVSDGAPGAEAAQPLPSSSGITDYPQVLYAISCLSLSACVTVGGDANNVGGGFVLKSGHWSLATLPSGTETLWGADCVKATTDCYITEASTAGKGAAIFESTNSGSTWKAQTIPTNAGGMYAISCITSSRCVAAGNNSTGGGEVIEKTTGSKFVAVKLPSGSGPLFGIDCESTTFCVAGGQNSVGQAEIYYTTTFSTWK